MEEKDLKKQHETNISVTKAYACLTFVASVLVYEIFSHAPMTSPFTLCPNYKHICYNNFCSNEGTKNITSRSVRRSLRNEEVRCSMHSMLSFRVAFSIFILERKKKGKHKNVKYVCVCVYREESSSINAFLDDRSVNKKGFCGRIRKKVEEFLLNSRNRSFPNFILILPLVCFSCAIHAIKHF